MSEADQKFSAESQTPTWDRHIGLPLPRPRTSKFKHSLTDKFQLLELFVPQLAQNPCPFSLQLETWTPPGDSPDPLPPLHTP